MTGVKPSAVVAALIPLQLICLKPQVFSSPSVTLLVNSTDLLLPKTLHPQELNCIYVPRPVPGSQDCVSGYFETSGGQSY